MSDYSDIFMLMGAIVIFSLLTINSNNALLQNTKRSLDSEVEYEAIALAQGEIDQARWSSYARLDSTASDYHFNGYPKTIATPEGDFTVAAHVDDISVTGTSSLHRRVTVQVSHEKLDAPVTLTYVKNQPN